MLQEEDTMTEEPIEDASAEVPELELYDETELDENPALNPDSGS